MIAIKIIKFERNYIRPRQGQSKLTQFSRKWLFEKDQEEEEKEYAPIFKGDVTTVNHRKVEMTEDLVPGRQGTTRDMGKFPLDHPKLVDFSSYLKSVDGGMRADTTAKEIVTDISKVLFYINPKCMKWASLVDAKALLDFFEYIRRRRISPQERLQKMERLGDAHKYMRFCARATPPPSPPLKEQRSV